MTTATATLDRPGHRDQVDPLGWIAGALDGLANAIDGNRATGWAIASGTSSGTSR